MQTSESGPAYQLDIREPDKDPRVKTLEVGEYRIGRSRECNIQLLDGYVSRFHCRLIVYSDERVSICDRRSHNGTLVNGQRLPPGEEHNLEAGDCVTLGGYINLTLVKV
ncbi:MAG: FHA domain-containing protein [Candidatus Binatia bacterium]